MKKLFILFTTLFLTTVMFAQNVAINNDGSSATGSAMLDVKSTTKGFMMPRMSSTDRASIVLPALGLLVFDTDTKTIWAYDGNSWKNLYTSGGGLILPFSQSVNTGSYAFQVTNDGTGAAIEGSSTAQFGIGMTAKTTGEASWGLFAFSNGAGSQSIRSYADNGTAFHGENNNAANTNTLMNLLNKGAGKTGSFQLANNSSTSPNVQIAGNHLGEQLKIYQTNAANTQAAVSIENSGTGAALYAKTANNGAGVFGESNTNYGVRGVTNTSTGFAGVHGQNNGSAGSGVVGVSNAANTQGVYGSSANGIAVRALSTNGTALDVNGNVKIAGGNTNPGAGKVLTSDANGNATWQDVSSGPTVGFKATGLMNGFPELGQNTDTKVQFGTQEYDLGNNFISITENGNLSEANVFYVPFNGLYHFNITIDFDLKQAPVGHYDYDFIVASINIIRNGNTIEMVRFHNTNPEITGQIIAGTDLVLNSGDRVFITARQSNFTGTSMPLGAFSFDQSFSGHLVKKL